MQQIQLLPYQCGLGSSTPGCERGPEVLRQREVEQHLSSSHTRVQWGDFYTSPEDSGAQPPIGSERRLELITDYCDQLRGAVGSALKNNRLPIAVGGDHTVSIGGVSGLAQARKAYGKTGLLWIDAHANVNTPETSPSHAIHGMALAILLGHGMEPFCHIGGAQPKVRPEHVCIIGARSMDPGEMDFLKELGVRIITRQEIKQTSFQSAIEEGISIVSHRTEARYLSFDMDAFDPTVAPGVGTPELDGLRAPEMLESLPFLIQNGRFDAMDIAEFNPRRDINGKTGILIESLLETMITGEEALVSHTERQQSDIQDNSKHQSDEALEQESA